MSEWLNEYGLSLAAVVAGVIVCTLSGLLSLTPDPEKPAKFLPVYALSMALFLFGLALVMRLEPVMQLLENVAQS